MLMKLITTHLPERYLAEIDEVVERRFEANRAECIRWFVRDYLKQKDSSVWDYALPEGKPRTKRCSFLIPHRMMTRLNRLVGVGYEVSIARLARTALRLYSAEEYRREFKSRGSTFSVILPIRTIDRLDRLVEMGHYENRSQIARNAFGVYLRKIEPHVLRTYSSKTRLIAFNMLPKDIKMLDWLAEQGYIQNRNEGILEAVNDGLLEMKEIMLRK